MGKKFFDLDVATHRAILKDKNGLSEGLAKLSIAEEDHKDYELTQIPEYFESYDVRKDPKIYVKDKLYEVVEQAFSTRRKLEKNMNRRDLYAYDKSLAKFLDKENLKV